MSFDFISDLSESKLFRSTKALDKLTDRDLVELAMLHMCALRVLATADETEAWTHLYARKTTRYQSFSRWQTDSSDLYVLLHRVQLKSQEEPFRFEAARVLRWLSDMSRGRVDEQETKRLLLRFEIDLKIKDPSIRAVTRLAIEWDHLTLHERRLLVTRLLQFFRARARNGEVLPYLERFSRAKGYEIKGVCNRETGENCSPEEEKEIKAKKPGKLLPFLAGIAGAASGAYVGYNAVRKK